MTEKISGSEFLNRLDSLISNDPILLKAIMANSNLAGKFDSAQLNDMDTLCLLIRGAINGADIPTA